MKMKQFGPYYVIVDITNEYAVTEIARGGSRAGNVSKYEGLAFGKPYIFSELSDANKALASLVTDNNQYEIKVPGKKKSILTLDWKVVEINISL